MKYAQKSNLVYRRRLWMLKIPMFRDAHNIDQVAKIGGRLALKDARNRNQIYHRKSRPSLSQTCFKDDSNELAKWLENQEVVK